MYIAFYINCSFIFFFTFLLILVDISSTHESILDLQIVEIRH